MKYLFWVMNPIFYVIYVSELLIERDNYNKREN